MTKVSDLSPHVSVLWWGLEGVGTPCAGKRKPAKTSFKQGGNTGHIIIIGDELTPDARKSCHHMLA